MNKKKLLPIGIWTVLMILIFFDFYNRSIVQDVVDLVGMRIYTKWDMMLYHMVAASIAYILSVLAYTKLDRKRLLFIGLIFILIGILVSRIPMMLIAHITQERWTVVVVFPFVVGAIFVIASLLKLEAKALMLIGCIFTLIPISIVSMLHNTG